MLYHNLTFELTPAFDLNLNLLLLFQNFSNNELVIK